MDYLAIERKWKKKWEEERLDSFDTKRADEKMYDLCYEPLDANGSIVTTPTEGATVSWT